MAVARQSWGPLAKAIPLGRDEVQVWQARVSPGLVAACQPNLSNDERARMERIRMDRAREEFVVGRGLLRSLVGSALGQAPLGIVFSVGEHGKPSVAGMEFNVSHSHGLVAIALCRSAAVGVDVERIDPSIEALEIAQDTFAPEEVERIRLVEGSERVRAFYECWTRKEAVVKAHGGGLTVPLTRFCVPMQSDAEARVRLTPELEPQTGEGYFVRSLAVEEGFAGALVTCAAGRVVTSHGVPEWCAAER
jgi:4'-phosphopantetheinyl transferase